MIDILGAGRVAIGALRLVAPLHPDATFFCVSRRPLPRDLSPNVKRAPIDRLETSRAPLIVCASVDEGRLLKGMATPSRLAVAAANRALLLDVLTPRMLANRLVLVVTNPVEPIAEMLRQLEPSAIVKECGLATDLERTKEVLVHGFGVRSSALGGLQIGGSHAIDAVPDFRSVPGLLEHLRRVRPDVVARRLSAYRSPLGMRAIGSVMFPVADPLAMVSTATRALTASEFDGFRPPHRRGAGSLARAIDAILRNAVQEAA